MKVTIQVTQEDIKNGQPTRCLKCPLALAATRAFGHQIFVARYTMFSMDVNGKVNFHGGKLPKEVTTWQWNFDNGIPVKPFDFEIEFD